MTSPAPIGLPLGIAKSDAGVSALDPDRSGGMGAPSEFLEPTAPYINPIREIHRGPDGYVTFHRKRGDNLENLGSVATAELETIFPEFAEELETDSYFSVNSFYRAGHYGQHLPALKPAHRKSDDARYLNACFVDIDFHDVPGPLDFGYQFGKVITMQDQGVIPPVSLVMRSGRGLWLFWLLVDSKEPLIPPRAFPEHALAYGAIERELARRTNADHAAQDIARITRVPGSMNTKAADSTRVKFWTQYADDGRAYFYTLQSLAEFLGIEAPRLRPKRQSVKARESGMRGWCALWQQRFEDFQALRQLRGGFSEGCRNRAAYIFAIILRGVGLDDNAIRQQVAIMGCECRPPLCEQAIRAAIDQSRESRRQLRDSTIAGYLKVCRKKLKSFPDGLQARCSKMSTLLT